MAKGSWIGIDSKARKIKKAFIGIDGVARKIKKMWIGIGNVARLFFSGGEIESKGTATSLSVARSNMASASNGSYALFAGGNGYSNVDAYNTSLTKSDVAKLNVAVTSPSGVSIGQYAIIGGGTTTNSNGYSVSVETTTTYNTALTKSSTPYPLGYPRTKPGTASNGSYALFAGGMYYYNGASTSNVDAYNTSLTRNINQTLSQQVRDLAGASVGSYALIAGGYNTGTSKYISDVWAFDTSLTKTTPTALTSGRQNLAGANSNTHAIFAGGGNNNGFLTIVDAYNASLTRITPTALNHPKIYLAGTYAGEFAIFAGGYGGYNSSTGLDDHWASIDVYDASLTRTSTVALSVARNSLSGVSVGNYALFGGGSSRMGTSNVVDVYSFG